MSREVQRRVGGFLEAVPIPMLAVDAQARAIGANAAAAASPPTPPGTNTWVGGLSSASAASSARRR